MCKNLASSTIFLLLKCQWRVEGAQINIYGTHIMKGFSRWCVLKCWLPSHKLRHPPFAPSEATSDLIFTSGNSCDKVTNDYQMTPGIPVPGAYVGVTVASGRAQGRALPAWVSGPRDVPHDEPTPSPALLPKAHSTKSPHSGCLFRLSHGLIAEHPLENWEIHIWKTLGVCAEKAVQGSLQGNRGTRPIRCLVDRGLRCAWDLHFPGCISFTWSLIRANPGRWVSLSVTFPVKDTEV